MEEEIKKLKAEKEKELQLLQEKIEKERKKEKERQALIEQTRKAHKNSANVVLAAQAAASMHHTGIITMAQQMEQPQFFGHNHSWSQAQTWGPSNPGDGCNIS